MPFGKYRGWAIEALPDAYLEWLCGIDLREPLASAVAEEATTRRARTPREVVRPSATLARQLVSAGRHTLAKRHHPDTGGSPGLMTQVNVTADWLLEQARAQLPS